MKPFIKTFGIAIIFLVVLCASAYAITRYYQPSLPENYPDSLDPAYTYDYTPEPFYKRVLCEKGTIPTIHVIHKDTEDEYTEIACIAPKSFPECTDGVDKVTDDIRYRCTGGEWLIYEQGKG